jgi:hypothetical protein
MDLVIQINYVIIDENGVIKYDINNIKRIALSIKMLFT